MRKGIYLTALLALLVLVAVLAAACQPQSPAPAATPSPFPAPPSAAPTASLASATAAPTDTPPASPAPTAVPVPIDTLAEAALKEIDASAATDEERVRKVVGLLFQTEGSQMTARDITVSFSEFFDPAALKMELYYYGKRQIVIEAFRIANTTVSAWSAQCEFQSVAVTGNTASVSVSVLETYQDSGSASPTSTNTQYSIQLSKVENKWRLTSIRADDKFDATYFETGFNTCDLMNQLYGTASACPAKRN